MQFYGNVATDPVRKVSKTNNKGYFEFRAAESQAGLDKEPTWFSVRVMKDVDPCLKKGDFVRVTGKLKTDFYLSREGKPTGTLLVIAFEATKRAKSDDVEKPATQASSKPIEQESRPIDHAMASAWSD